MLSYRSQYGAESLVVEKYGRVISRIWILTTSAIITICLQDAVVHDDATIYQMLLQRFQRLGRCPDNTGRTQTVYIYTVSVSVISLGRTSRSDYCLRWSRESDIAKLQSTVGSKKYKDTKRVTAYANLFTVQKSKLHLRPAVLFLCRIDCPIYKA